MHIFQSALKDLNVRYEKTNTSWSKKIWENFGVYELNEIACLRGLTDLFFSNVLQSLQEGQERSLALSQEPSFMDLLLEIILHGACPGK